jgi:ACS family tartrate transporter-like MFS transporter
LTPEERGWITAEVSREEQVKLAAGRMTAVQALMHGKVWYLTAIYFAATVGFYTMIFWMPQMLKALSSQYSNTMVGLLVTIPYFVGLPVMILVGRSSDRRLERRYHAAIPLIIASASLIVLGLSTSGSVFLSVTLWCFVASGYFCLWGPFWSLPNEFLTGFSAAAGIALINCFGNLGGFVGPYAIGAISKWTGNLNGGLVFTSISLFVSAMLILSLRKRNALESDEAEMAQSNPT